MPKRTSFSATSFPESAPRCLSLCAASGSTKNTVPFSFQPRSAARIRVARSAAWSDRMTPSGSVGQEVAAEQRGLHCEHDQTSIRERLLPTRLSRRGAARRTLSPSCFSPAYASDSEENCSLAFAETRTPCAAVVRCVCRSLLEESSESLRLLKWPWLEGESQVRDPIPSVSPFLSRSCRQKELTFGLNGNSSL